MRFNKLEIRRILTSGVRFVGRRFGRWLSRVHCLTCALDFLGNVQLMVAPHGAHLIENMSGANSSGIRRGYVPQRIPDLGSQPPAEVKSAQ